MMTTRTKYVNLKRLAEIHESARNSKRIVVAHASETNPAIINAVAAHEMDTRQALIDALSGQHWRGYEVCIANKRHGSVSSAMLATALKISLTNASTLLKDLHEVGLLERRRDYGSEYMYWVNEDS